MPLTGEFRLVDNIIVSDEPEALVPPRLDPLVKRLFVGIAFSALGSGLTMPFLYVYLAEMRGISTSTVGLLFAWMGLLGFVGSPLGGTLIDRFGPRPVMIVGLTAEAIGVASLALVQNTWHAFLVSSFITLGTVGLYPASTAMLTRLVPEEAREKVYGFQFMLLNAGLGVGGVVSGLMISTSDVTSFQRLYLVDALSYVVYIAVILSLPRGTGAMARREAEEEIGPQPGWREVLRDRTLVRVVAMSVVVVTFGYAQFEAGFAAYTVDVAGVPAKSLGWAFGANTAAIVLGQLVTLRLIKGRRRTSMLALCAAIWSLSWAVIASSDAVERRDVGAAGRRGARAVRPGRDAVGPGGPGDHQRPGHRGAARALQRAPGDDLDRGDDRRPGAGRPADRQRARARVGGLHRRRHGGRRAAASSTCAGT